jgi:hypothetical protein
MSHVSIFQCEKMAAEVTRRPRNGKQKIFFVKNEIFASDIHVRLQRAYGDNVTGRQKCQTMDEAF